MAPCATLTWKSRIACNGRKNMEHKTVFMAKTHILAVEAVAQTAMYIDDKEGRRNCGYQEDGVKSPGLRSLVISSCKGWQAPWTCQIVIVHRVLPDTRRGLKTGAQSGEL